MDFKDLKDGILRGEADGNLFLVDNEGRLLPKFRQLQVLNSLRPERRLAALDGDSAQYYARQHNGVRKAIIPADGGSTYTLTVPDITEPLLLGTLAIMYVDSASRVRTFQSLASGINSANVVMVRGDGIATVFNFFLPYAQIVEGSVVMDYAIGAAPHMLDDTAVPGILDGPDVVSGTIDYVTGEVNLEFANPLDADSFLRVNWQVAIPFDILGSSRVDTVPGDTLYSISEYLTDGTYVRPRSLRIPYHTATESHMLVDDGLGNLVDLWDGYLVVGSVNYNTGSINFESSEPLIDTLFNISYQRAGLVTGNIDHIVPSVFLNFAAGHEPLAATSIHVMYSLADTLEATDVEFGWYLTNLANRRVGIRTARTYIGPASDGASDVCVLRAVPRQFMNLGFALNNVTGTMGQARIFFRDGSTGAMIPLVETGNTFIGHLKGPEWHYDIMESCLVCDLVAGYAEYGVKFWVPDDCRVVEFQLFADAIPVVPLSQHWWLSKLQYGKGESLKPYTPSGDVRYLPVPDEGLPGQVIANDGRGNYYWEWAGQVVATAGGDPEVPLAVATPVNLTPPEGATNVDFEGLVLQGSVYYNTRGIPHSITRITVYEADGITVFHTQMKNVGDLTQVTLSIDLPQDATFFWSMQHEDAVGTLSDWSDLTSFTTVLAEVVTPVVLAPTGSPISRRGEGLTVTTAEFASSNPLETHESTDYYIYSDPTGTTLVYSVLNSLDLLGTTIPTAALGQGVFYVGVVHNGSFGFSAQSALEPFELTSSVADPTIVTPIESASVQPVADYVFASSAFSSADLAETQAASSWELRDEFGNLVASSYVDAVNLVSWEVDLTLVTPGPHTVSVTHLGTVDFSGWSAVRNFSIVAGSVVTPIIYDPLDGYHPAPITLNWSAFESVGIVDMQVGFRIQLSDSPSFSRILHDVEIPSAASEYEIPIEFTPMPAVYHWRVQVEGDLLGWSEWADSTFYASEEPPPPPPPPTPELDFPESLWYAGGQTYLFEGLHITGIMALNLDRVAETLTIEWTSADAEVSAYEHLAIDAYSKYIISSYRVSTLSNSGYPESDLGPLDDIDWVRGVAMSASGGHCSAAYHWPATATARVYSIGSGGLTSILATADPGGCYATAINSTGTLFAFLSDGFVYVYQRQGETVSLFGGPQENPAYNGNALPGSMEFSSDGKFLAVISPGNPPELTSLAIYAVGESGITRTFFTQSADFLAAYPTIHWRSNTHTLFWLSSWTQIIGREITSDGLFNPSVTYTTNLPVGGSEFTTFAISADGEYMLISLVAGADQVLLTAQWTGDQPGPWQGIPSAGGHVTTSRVAVATAPVPPPVVYAPEAPESPPDATWGRRLSGWRNLYMDAPEGNLVMGRDSGLSLPTDENNIGLGVECLQNTGVYNIAIGYRALRTATTPSIGNVAIGVNAGRLCDTGIANCFIGYGAGEDPGLNPGAGGVVAIGYYAGRHVAANRNIMIGNFAGRHMDTPFGTSNVIIGDEAGMNAKLSTNNVAIGTGSMINAIDDVINNVAIGTNALGMIDGNHNVAVGHLALAEARRTAPSTAFSNVAVGAFALERADGFFNTAVGEGAFSRLGDSATELTRQSNVAVGTRAGEFVEGGSLNIYIGSQSGPVGVSDKMGEIVIGGITEGSGNYTMTLANVHDSTTAEAPNMYVSSFGQIMRSTSSMRYKKDVEVMEDPYSENIYKFRPVWYRSKAEKDNPDHSHWGFIAEEVAEIDPRLVDWAYTPEDWEVVDIISDKECETRSKAKGEDPKNPSKETIKEATTQRRQLKAGATKTPQGVFYDRFVVLLVKEVQKLRAEVNELKAAKAPKDK